MRKGKELIPFVVVGMPRTGSTLLLTGIAQHPEVLAYGELLHPVDSERLGPHAIVRDDAKIAYLNRSEDDAIEFLKNEVFVSFGEVEKAIGFKVFGDLVKGPGTERFFVRLKEAFPTLRVIHIVRENYLEALVSRDREED